MYLLTTVDKYQLPLSEQTRAWRLLSPEAQEHSVPILSLHKFQNAEDLLLNDDSRNHLTLNKDRFGSASVDIVYSPHSPTPDPV